MNNDNIYLPTKIFSGIYGHNIDAYLISLEGWRRGLTLTWYREHTPINKFNHTTDTAGKFFSLESKDRKHYFYRSRGDLVANASTQICIKKQDTKNVLKEKNISVPEGEKFDLKNRQDILTCADEIPCID